MSSAISEHICRVAVGEACSRHGIAHDSELAKQLMSESEIADGRNPVVRTTSGVSLDERVQELAKIAKFAKDVPAAKPSVQASDMAAMSANIADIASGKVTVR
jgi:hypothetical protein